MALGATAYMIKPLRKTELLAAIDFGNYDVNVIAVRPSLG